MHIDDVDLTKISPMMKQYIDIKKENEDNILFFRLGDFYEMFFEDAINVSNLLELTLTGKNCGLDERVPMCGIPFHAAEGYINKLIEMGYKVAICEQVEDPKLAKGLVKRDIIQVVSSGTKMNSESLDEKENNYIGYILDLGYAYSIAYSDITTGELNAFIIEKDEEKLRNEILQRNIKEIVIKSDFDRLVLDKIRKTYNLTISIYNNENLENDYSKLYSSIEDERVIKAVNNLISYLETSQKRSLDYLRPVNIVNENSFMQMDINTKRNLELTENIRTKERRYSLLWLLDKTKTAMGSRKLKSFILNPLTDKKEIEKRYDKIEVLMKEFLLKDELRENLSSIYDLERLVGRIGFSSANARDLLWLKTSLSVLPDINDILKKLGFEEINTFTDLYELLDKSIYEDAPISLKEGYLIKEGYNPELDEIKDARKNNKDFISKLENEERQRTGIKTLKLGFNKVFGYYIEVSKGAIKDIKEEYGYERKQTLANAERFVTPLLKEKEALILGAEEKIINMEYEMFIEIRNKVKEYIPALQGLSSVLSEIDVLSSLALVSEGNNYVRPVLNEEHIIDIKEGRHPVIEKVLDSEFISNDIYFDQDDLVMLITGPNMAGKSTYMRQMAIISIMAQMGCFVPATSANIPIFDKIFTRIGASDDLVSGESTFMVEMSEANRALKHATKDSLILFDELGRGTATFDGMSLAAAIIEYIHNNVKAKTFFSTHYHELTDLETTLPHLKNVHVSASLENGNLVFLHKIKEGSIDKSYGIHVAKLAHLPESLIERANEILKTYEDNDKSNSIKPSQLELNLDFSKESKIEEEIKNMDILKLTPIDALNELYRMKKELENEENN
ncbi:MAG: DNA mismatch repair protein MutS [Bacilli bacterium]|nr:DNA mismatch repair protein MutS [Bacilli bacterium]